MKRDIHKFSAWLEQKMRDGLAEERAVSEWKLAQKPLHKPAGDKSSSSMKAS